MGEADGSEEDKDGEEPAEAPPAKKARRVGPFRVVKVPKGEAETAVWAKLEELIKTCGVTAEFEDAYNEDVKKAEGREEKQADEEGAEKDVAEDAKEKDEEMKAEDAKEKDEEMKEEKDEGKKEKDEGQSGDNENEKSSGEFIKLGAVV